MTEAPTTQEMAGPADLGRALGTLLRTYLAQAGTAVEDLPGGPRGFQVMSVADGNACSNQATIAERLGLDRTVMTYLVDDLEQAGLVERRPDPADRRARRVVLTGKGSTAYAAAAARIKDVERAVLGGISDADADLFRELLHRITVAGPQADAAEVCNGPAPGTDAC
jgi:DNA-binding MarR family transcriptional regulator